ncbi:helix-turn-helix domain-containing protein [Streptomyces pinistramenti]|uniref:helix-turn-helix domain-containing protein n=1 Tax=Streptomyces pinistramenti TaxID=2884812 RepID=UPI001D07165A|nr:helix-turn-helix transcriptional regulator [Streptomyces pinistramenti]MCB5906131.1 helix-turn-helix transcriptional regulator [Streptomyces pinistramenti]
MSGRRAAAQELRGAIPEITEAYRDALEDIGSPLAYRDDIWEQCRHQAQSIVDECAQALEGGKRPESPGAGEYTRLLGALRVVQQVPVSESVRAADVLWQAMQTVMMTVLDRVEVEQRAAAVQTVSTAFRVAAGYRLYQGIRAYEEAQRSGTSAEPERGPAPSSDGANAQALGLLTLREREILEAVRAGLTNRLISRRFDISEATVKRHLHNVYRKLGVGSRVQALNTAFPSSKAGVEPLRYARPVRALDHRAPRAISTSRFEAYCVTMNAR